MLTNPNYKQSFEELGKDFIRNLFSGGFSYLLPYHENPAYVNFIDKGSSLICLNNDNIDFGGRSIKLFQNDISFDYTYNFEKKVFNYKQIIPFYDIAQDPKNSFIGVSRVKALEQELSQIWISNKAIDNQIKLSGNIIVTPEAVKESEMSMNTLDKPIVSVTGKTHKQDIEEKLNASGIIFGKSLTVATTALKAINLAESLKDYDYNSKFKQEAGRIILNLFGIPRKLQNIITQSELKSDKEGEDIDLYEKVVLPVAENFAKSINSQYSKLTKTKIELSYSHLSVFAERQQNTFKTESEHKQMVSGYVSNLYEKQLITRDEARKLLKDGKIIEG
ncbi:hypothetical protein CHRYSEOSP005_14850 [Chryseobacterium sp. Alg-005]